MNKKSINNITGLGKYDYAEIETDEEIIQYPSNSTDDISIKTLSKKERTEIFISSDRSRIKYIKLRWKIEIQERISVLGDAWERGYGDLEWKGMDGNRFMPWYFLIRINDHIYGIGVCTGASSMCYWQIDPKGITLLLDVRNGGNGVYLKGRELKAAEIVFMDYCGDSFEAACHFCKMMCSNPVFPKAPVYGSNNWYYAYGKSTATKILQDTDYLMKLTGELENPPYMVIDDCWQEHHRVNQYNGGPWKCGNADFPDMKKLADEITKKGAIPGIWIRLLQNEDESIKPEQRISHNGCIDPSNPEMLDYIKEDIRRICEWGYRLIKHDFSTYDLFGRWGLEMNPYVTSEGWNFYDETKTSAEIIKSLYKVIYDVASEYDAIVMGCNTIGHLGAGMMQIQRAGDDISGKNWERTRRMGINTLAFRLPQNRAFFDIDADCVGITERIPWAMNMQWAEVIAYSGTSLFVAAKPGVLNEEEQRKLSEIFKIASKADKNMRPVDWEYTNCPEIWSDGRTTMKYDWYEEKGSWLVSKEDKYYIYLPTS